MQHVSAAIITTLGFTFSNCTAYAAAPEYPNKPIRLIVPFAAGGPMDIMSRAIGEKMTAA